MNIDTITLVGLSATTCILISQIPEILRALKLKETRDLSWGMIVLLIVGTVLWLIYGLLKTDNIIILANSIMLAILAVLLSVKVRYK
ncbi:MAG TPA: SemiSWEET family transporter [Candidatus Saccharibacteria bacterium]|nr:SemiSWEET family transporter [Candidatus Saccharibacteria bacterium]HMT39800.1 SemiSWEET family transporter [Candidatus Saccharibacteria bacterium]